MIDLRFLFASMICAGSLSAQMWPDGMRGAMLPSNGDMAAPDSGGAVLKFQIDFESGESQLGGDDITVNGATVAAICAYRGRNFLAGSWAGTQGTTLIKPGALTTPSEIYGVFSDSTEAVKFTNGDDIQESPVNKNCGIAAQDMVIEFAARFDDSMIAIGGNRKFILKRDTAAAAYWSINGTFGAASVDIVLEVSDGTTTTTATLATVNYDEWNHLILFWDRQTGGKAYLNGIAGAALPALATVSGSIGSATTPFRIGGEIVAEVSGDLAFVKIWRGADDAWFSSATQDDIAAERFQRVAGYWPTVAPPSGQLATISRASSATVEMWDGTAAADSTRLHTVGAGWPRVSCRGNSFIDTGARTCGGVYERQHENRLADSEDMTAASWAKLNIAAIGDAITAPNGKTTADGIRATTTSSVSHRLGSATGLTPARFSGLSIYAKPGAVDYVYLRLNQVTEGVVFNVATCAVEQEFSNPNISVGNIEQLGAAGSWCRIRAYGNSRFFSLYMVDGPLNEAACLADLAACTSYAAADTVSAQMYFWGAQFDRDSVSTFTADSTSSYIKTVGGISTRIGDGIRFDSSDIFPNRQEVTGRLSFLQYPSVDDSGNKWEASHYVSFTSDPFTFDDFWLINTARPMISTETTTTNSVENANTTILYGPATDDGTPKTLTFYQRDGLMEQYINSVLTGSTSSGSVPPGGGGNINNMVLGWAGWGGINAGTSNALVDGFSMYQGRAVP